jgi:carboxyl-terminal processing protease
LFAFTTADTSLNHTHKDSLLIDVISTLLQREHFDPQEIDDSFSEKLFDTYLNRLDIGKKFFLQSDLDEFSKHRLKLDDYVLVQDFTFFDLATKTRSKRAKEVHGYYTDILSKPFDFNTKDSLETNVDNMSFAKNSAELLSRWRNLLNYSVLASMESKLARQEKAAEEKDTTIKINTIVEIEKDARNTLLKEYDRWYVKVGQQDRDDQMAVFLNTITSVFGPHSSYFPPLEKENFDIRMTGKLEGIGAQLREKDGYIKVARIVPGSASWRQGELEVDDLIIKVAQGKEDPVDIVDVKMNAVLPLIRGEKGTEVRLTVKKTDGSTKVIPIIRDVVVLAESYAKSAVLEFDNNEKHVGLIDLRTFYADFNDPTGRRCATDVKAEVEKLIKEGVQGIVVDLRFNGGGSLADAVDMSGLFIEKGPIVQVKDRIHAPKVLSDPDPKIVYAGRLIILVNAYSASASEIMAAALQDYGRAIIVGTSATTFGKGTVQRFYDLDRVVPPAVKELGELGSIKITTQKFFRINGGSTQLKGVTPDIVLPGINSYRDIGERQEDFVMPWTSVPKANYEEYGIKKMAKLKKQSQARVDRNEIFDLIDESGKWYKSMQDETLVSLNFEEFRAQQKSFTEKSKKFKQINQESSLLEVAAPFADTSFLNSDTIRAKSINNWHKVLKKDPYVLEVLQIFADWE